MLRGCLAGNGAGTWLQNGAVQLVDTVYSGNRAQLLGGAIYLANGELALSMSSTTLGNNTAGSVGSTLFSLSSGPLELGANVLMQLDASDFAAVSVVMTNESTVALPPGTKLGPNVTVTAGVTAVCPISSLFRNVTAPYNIVRVVKDKEGIADRQPSLPSLHTYTLTTLLPRLVRLPCHGGCEPRVLVCPLWQRSVRVPRWKQPALHCASLRQVPLWCRLHSRCHYSVARVLG